MTPVLTIVFLLMGTGTASPPDPCRQWQTQVNALTETEKRTLEDAGAVYASDHIVISEKRVSDCKARVGIGQYIYDAVAGRVSKEDRRVALTYSSQIRAMLQSIWPGLSDYEVISDGARGEIYTAILYLRPYDRLRLTRSVLAGEGLTLSLTDVVIRSNMTELGPKLVEVVKTSKDQNQQIYALAALAALRNPAGIQGLTRLLSTRTLNPQQTQVAEKIVHKAMSNQTITSEDLLDLEYEP